MRKSPNHDRLERGDWQTPDALAVAVTELAARHGLEAPAAVLEPTCGRGAFLRAAACRFPGARLVGYDLRPEHVRQARKAVPSERGSVQVANFFDVAWEEVLATLPEPILVLGNPPWVTNARLGALGARNLPRKANSRGLRGIDAITGRSNFDVSEWMILRLLTALAPRRAALAFLCKSQVARRVIEGAPHADLAIDPGGLFRIDAARGFDAAVDAALFVCRPGGRSPGRQRWPVYASIGATRPSSSLAIRDGSLVPDARRYARTRHLAGHCAPEWRSGVKHDCARVMELRRDGGRWRNGLGEAVRVEEDVLYPLLKSSDVANGRVIPTRALVVTQQRLGQDTYLLRERAPRAWAYLVSHGSLLDARKSAIYARQPRFALFGLGDYSFAPWKVAVSGLYKRCAFVKVGPHEGRPVLLDDTCYFLPFADEASATRALAALSSQDASDFFAARVFWDAKRPLSKALLQSLALQRLYP